MANFAEMTLPQLYQLQKDLDAEISRRKVEDRQKTLSDLQKLAEERGFNLSDLLQSGDKDKEKGKRAGGKRGPVAAQFKNPANAEQTWTGRGRKPQWVAEHLDKGGNLDDLRV